MDIENRAATRIQVTKSRHALLMLNSLARQRRDPGARANAGSSSSNVRPAKPSLQKELDTRCPRL